MLTNNRLSGNSTVGTEFVARAKPDGHTVLQMAVANAIVAALQDVPYDLQRDFTAVAGIGSSPLALVVPAQTGIRSVQDLAAYARSKPHGLTYASGGIGSLGHLTAVRLARSLCLPATYVPYRSNGLAAMSLLAGQTDLLFGAVVDVTELANAGKLCVIAVTSDARAPTLPDVPTMVELGFADFTPTLWYGYVVPAGTPGEVVGRLAGALDEAAAEPALQERLAQLGMTVRPTSGPDFARFMHDEFERWKKIIVDNHITPAT